MTRTLESVALASPDSLGKRTLAATLWTYGGAIGRVFAQLVIQLALARFLGPDAFGQATAALLVHSLGWIFAEAGFGAALVQKDKLTDEDVSYALGWVLLISIGSGLLVVAASPWIAIWLGGAHLRDLIMACGLLIPIQALSNIPVSLMRRELDAKRSQIIYLSGYLLCYGTVGITLAMLGAGPWALVAAFGAHSLYNLVASYLVVRHTLRPRLHGNAALRRFGLQVTGANCANWAIENLDRVLIGRLWGSAPLGAYAAAFTLSRAPVGLLLGSIQPVLFAAASRIQDERERLARVYLGVIAFAALMSWPAFAWMCMNASALIHLLYGDRWDQAIPLFTAFSAGLPFVALMSLTGPVLWSVKAVRQDIAAQCASLAVVLVGLPLLSGLPLAQAVWLIPVTYALRGIWMVVALAKELVLPLGALAHALRGGTVLVAVAVLLGLVSGSLLHDFGGIAIGLAHGGGLVVVSLLLLRLIPRQLLSVELLDLLRNRAGTSRVIARFLAWIKVAP
jgi:PST family polysaccharide transporter